MDRHRSAFRAFGMVSRDPPSPMPVMPASVSTRDYVKTLVEHGGERGFW
jgi:hypothetical protein